LKKKQKRLSAEKRGDLSKKKDGKKIINSKQNSKTQENTSAVSSVKELGTVLRSK
jgi:hypothetical protein